MLAGGSVAFSTGGNGGTSSFKNRTRASNPQTSRHLRGDIRSKLARASDSIELAAALVRVSLGRIDVSVRLPLPSVAIRMRLNPAFYGAIEHL